MVVGIMKLKNDYFTILRRKLYRSHTGCHAIYVDRLSSKVIFAFANVPPI